MAPTKEKAKAFTRNPVPAESTSTASQVSEDPAAPAWQTLSVVFAVGLLAGWLALLLVGVHPRGMLPHTDNGLTVENAAMDVTQLHAKWQLGSEEARLRAARVDSVLAEAARVGKAASMATKESWAARKAAAEQGLTSAWDDVAKDVAVAVRVEASTAAVRLPTLQDTWLQTGRVPNLVVVTDNMGAGVPNDALVATQATKELVRKLKTNKDKLKGGVESSPGQGWEEQGGKDNTFLPALSLLYKAYPEKSYYMVVDDNSYVFLDSIGRVLKQRMDRAKNRAVCLGRGYLVTGCVGLSDSGYSDGARNPMFPQGDSGFILSQYTMSKLVPHVGECIRDYRNCWAGDMRVGMCLQAAGVEFEFAHDNNFNWFFPGTPRQLIEEDEFAKYRKSSDWPLTIPEVGMEEMHKLWGFEMDYGPYDTTFRNLVRHWKGDKKPAPSTNAANGKSLDPWVWTGIKTYLYGADDMRRFMRQCYRRKVVPGLDWLH